MKSKYTDLSNSEAAALNIIFAEKLKEAYTSGQSSTNEKLTILLDSIYKNYDDDDRESLTDGECVDLVIETLTEILDNNP